MMQQLLVLIVLAASLKCTNCMAMSNLQMETQTQYTIRCQGTNTRGMASSCHSKVPGDGQETLNGEADTNSLSRSHSNAGYKGTSCDQFALTYGVEVHLSRSM